MAVEDPKTYALGEFQLQPETWSLTRDHIPLRLSSRQYRVLLYLINNRDRLVSRTELLEKFWDGRAAYDENLTKCVGAIRKILSDRQKDQPRFIETRWSEGYRYIGPFKEVELDPEVQAATNGRKGEVTVEGANRILTMPEDGSGKRHSVPSSSALSAGTRRFAVITVVILVVVAGGVLLLKSQRRQAPATAGNEAFRSIAVLPLKNMSDDPANEYFSDGLTESLITALSQVTDLKVISSGSVMRFKGKETDPREVGRQLAVAAVLEGSVRKSADSVRVAVRLVSVDDGRVLWVGDTNERELGDVFALQDEIARSLVAGLKVRLSGEVERRLARRPTENVEAYQLYLKGRYFWNKRTEAGLKRSIEYFEQAIGKDPQFALAHAGLADSYAIFNLYSTAQLRDALPRARDAAERALVLDDTLAEAHTVLALVKEQYEWDWTGAEHEFKRAIELNPNYATAHQYYSEYLAFRGRTEESLAHIKQAHNLDPFSLIINTTLGYPYLCARQCDPAIKEFRKAREMDPNFPLAIFYTARCYELEAKYDQAIAEYRQAVAVSGGSSLALAGLGHAYAKSGRSDQARGVLNELTEISKLRYVSPYLIGTIYAGLGENDQALQRLEKAHRDHDYSLVLLKVDARLDGLRQHPRFAELQQRIGLGP